MRAKKLRRLLGDGVEIISPLITVLRGYDGLRIRNVPDSEIGFDLHTEAGDALMWLRYAQGNFIGGGVDIRGG